MNLSFLTLLAIKTIGTPYRWGGQNLLEGFDCSGFVRYLLRSVGELPYEDLTAQGIHDYLSRESLPQVRGEGSIVFFGKSPREIKHLAYCISEKLMVEAYGDKSVVDLASAAAFQGSEGAHVRIFPIDRRLDLAAVYRPSYRNLE